MSRIVRGGFPSGLAGELGEKSQGAPAWYRSFLDGTVIPNGGAFGYLIEIGETAIGVLLVVAAVQLASRYPRRSERVLRAALVAVAAASAAGILMNVNFHLANGAAHPWLIPRRVRRGSRPRQPDARDPARPARGQRRAVAVAPPRRAHGIRRDRLARVGGAGRQPPPRARRCWASIAAG